MSARASLGGMSTDARASHDGRNTIPSAQFRDLPPMPAGSLLEPGDVSDSFRDVIAVGFAFLFVSSVGIGLAFAAFCLLFVDLR